LNEKKTVAKQAAKGKTKIYADLKQTTLSAQERGMPDYW
jgi:hypothetical protein